MGKSDKTPGKVYTTFDGNDETPLNYLVIIDAGSSGSRVHIYNYPDLKQIQAQSKSTSLLPEISKNDHKWFKKEKPGMSAYNGKSSKNFENNYLKPLLSYAQQIVPQSQHYRTPIFLHATAGLRVLKPSDSQNLLNKSCKYFKKHSEFLIPDCETSITMIDGEIEGIFGWLSVNYLTGGLQNPNEHQHGKDHFTYGFLDMGGASTQVTFVPNATEIERTRQNLYTVNLPSINGENDMSFQVSSNTYLRLGVNEAHNQILEKLVLKRQYENPCAPVGINTIFDKKKNKIVDFSHSKRSKSSSKTNSKHKINDSDSDSDTDSESETDHSDDEDHHKTSRRHKKRSPNKRGSTVEMKGTGDFAKCQTLLKPLAASIKDSNRPEFDFDINHLIAVSEYWDTTHSAFSMGGKFRKEKVFSKVKTFCESDWDTIATAREKDGLYTEIRKKDLYDLCFRASWILTVIDDGLGITSIEEEVDEENDSHNETLSDFLSPLQSIDTINGLKYSWTLGRAVLYASAEQSMSDHIRTAGILSNVNIDSANFHYGLPVLSRPKFDPKTLLTPHNKSHSNKHDDDDDDDDDDWEDMIEDHPHRLWGSLLFLMILFIILYLILGKARRQKMWITVKSKIPLGSNGSSYLQSNPNKKSIGAIIGGAIGSVYSFFGGSKSRKSRSYRRMSNISANDIDFVDNQVEDIELGLIPDTDEVIVQAKTINKNDTNNSNTDDVEEEFRVSSDEEETK